jgi:hypothetical protein
MGMFLKKSAVVLFAGGILWAMSCQPPPPRKMEVGPGNPNTPAGKAGKLVYKVEKETEKAAREAGRKIDEATRDAHAGYKDAEKKPDR